MQQDCDRLRPWRAKQKPTVLQEWQTRVLSEEICREWTVNVAQMYR